MPYNDSEIMSFPSYVAVVQSRNASSLTILTYRISRTRTILKATVLVDKSIRDIFIGEQPLNWLKCSQQNVAELKKKQKGFDKR